MALTIQQFGDSIKTKYPQYQNVDSTQLGQAVLKKYPQYQTSVQPQSFNPVKVIKNLLGGAVDQLPNILGTVGQVTGNALGGAGAAGAEIGGLGPEDPLADAGAAGSLAFGNRVLAPTLSAGGQGIGEFIKELIKGKGVSGGNVAKATAEGGLYGLVPGGEADKGFLKNLISRFISGTAVGGGSQAISDIGNGKSIPSDLPDIAKSGVETGALNSIGFPILSKILKAPFSTIGAVGKHLTESAGDIQKAAIEQPAQLEKELNDLAVGYRFGNKNIDFAKNSGLVSSKGLSNEGLQEEQQLIHDASLKKEDELQKALRDSGVKLKPGDVFAPLEEDARNNGLNMFKNAKNLPIGLKQVRDILLNASKNTDPNSKSVYKDIPISVVNDANRALSPYFNKGQVYQDMYMSLKNMIEEESGIPDKIKQMKQESHALTIAKGNNQKLQNKFGSYPKEYTPNGIKEAVSEARKGNLKNITHKISLLTAPLDLGGYLLGHFPGYIVASHIMPSIKENIVNNPESIEKYGGKMGRIGKSAVNFSDKTGHGRDNLSKFLKQYGIRIPG